MNRKTAHPQYNRMMELLCLLPLGWKGADLNQVATDLGMAVNSQVFGKMIRDAKDAGHVWVVAGCIGLTSTNARATQATAEKWWDGVYS